MSLPYDFQKECEDEIKSIARDSDLMAESLAWLARANAYKYSYHFRWLGRPIIQYPQDIVSVQELIWDIKPDLIIETGIAHGGSLILSASMLALLDLCEAIESGNLFDPRKSNRLVMGVDIDIRPHNRSAIEAHPMATRIKMIQGSSIAPEIIEQVHRTASGFKKVLVCLDSNHSHEHVLAELQAYAPLTTIGSYCVVFDTIVEDLPADAFHDRPWGPGNSPKTAVHEFLTTTSAFRINKSIDHKLLISVAPDGFLERLY